MNGGFLRFPGAAFSTDASASGMRSPLGAAWLSYDAPAQRWLPVTREMMTPDGKIWLYGKVANGNAYHAVDVNTGKDTALWGSDQAFRFIGLDNAYAYTLLDGPAGTRLWRLPLNGSVGGPLKVNGIWQFVNGGKVWGTGAASQPAGASYSLQVLDVPNNTITTWIELDHQAEVVGFAADGGPILQVGGAGGDVIVVPSPGEQYLVAKGFLFATRAAGFAPLPALGDANGIWLAGSDGIYLSVNGVANKQSDVKAFPAGPCL